MHNRSSQQSLTWWQSLFNQLFTSCQVNQYTVPEARAEHLWAVGCPFGTTVSEQGVGFRFIRKVAEVNVRLLPNLQGYHHFQSHSSAHVWLPVTSAICSYLCGRYPWPTCLCIVCETGFYLNSGFSHSGTREVQKGQRAMNFLGFGFLAHGDVMQFGWSLTFLCTPDFCRGISW